MAEVRRDIITDTWVIVGTEESEPPVRRPGQGPGTRDQGPGDCPFCEGHEAMTPPEVFALRAEGTNPNCPGWQVRVVPNNRPVLRIEGELKRHGAGIHDMVTGIGANEVIIETPRHESVFSNLSREQISLALQTYRQRICDLYRDKRLRYVMIFKNYGWDAGAPAVVHAHSELIALPATPRLIKDELNGARSYFEYKERCIFCDIMENERETEKRVLLESPHFVAFAPYASRFPYELTVMPRSHAHSFELASGVELADLGEVLKRALTCLRDLLGDVPYNFVLHTTPNLLPLDGYWRTVKDDYHWHVEVIPRVKRVVGFEWGSGFHINPMAPERAVALLREKL